MRPKMLSLAVPSSFSFLFSSSSSSTTVALLGFSFASLPKTKTTSERRRTAAKYLNECHTFPRIHFFLIAFEDNQKKKPINIEKEEGDAGNFIRKNHYKQIKNSYKHTLSYQIFIRLVNFAF